MNTYRTSEIAEIIGVHPNTVRLYEELGLIPKPGRLPNGYRVFTELHIEQFRRGFLHFNNRSAAERAAEENSTDGKSVCGR